MSRVQLIKNKILDSFDPIEYLNIHLDQPLNSEVVLKFKQQLTE